MSTESATFADAALAPSHPSNAARNSLVINLLLVSAFVVMLNETIMNVALPRLMTDLGVSSSTVQWLATGFMLTIAVVIPTTGFILQRLTTRQAFMAATGFFTAGTAMAAAIFW